MSSRIFFLVLFVIPPIGQWVSCDDPRYKEMCDFPTGPSGPPPDNQTIPDNMTIVLTQPNGTKIDLIMFKNGTTRIVK